ncbi:MAG: hypothetical protein H6741_13205 [Alphaproteobacteria bacterium]|nr:hypothetical protein [Alphaproteobacteria bacterium]MCB9793674.1 hypothetical protein [Alphaproteobacteria bacterium]
MQVQTPAKALESPDTVTGLYVSPGWDTPWQALVSQLPRLRRVHLKAGVDADPRAVSAWPDSFCNLSLGSPEHLADLPLWHDAAPHIDELELWLEAEEALDLPEVIGAFLGLRTLSVKANVPVRLPASLAESGLVTLKLVLPEGELPAGVCRLASLQQLRLVQHVRTLPDALAELTHLHTLDLSWSLNQGTMSADERPASSFHPMPTVIARLPALQALNVDQCGIFERDIETLAGHPRLAALSLAWGGVADLRPFRDLPALRRLLLKACLRVRELSPLAGLPLEQLSLHNCRRVRDLRPLLELPRLRLLDLEGCDEAELAPVLLHPSLERIGGNEEQLAQWERRTELSGLSPEGIRAGLGSEDPAAIATALGQLATWVELTSGRDGNALVDLLEPGDEAREAEDPVEVPLLSAALSTPGLDPAQAARVFAACFRSVQDNFVPALTAAEVVVERGDEATQRALVDAVLFARRFYDAGHRTWDDAVHETLLCELLPRLAAPALVHLLAELTDDDLSSDELDGLFADAYRSAGEAETAALDERLRSYVEDYLEYKGPAYFRELLDAVAEAQPAAAKRLADLVPEEEAAGWQERLVAATDPASAREVLEALLHAVDEAEIELDELGPLWSWAREPLGRAAPLSVDLARRLVEVGLATGQQGWLNAAVLTPLVRQDLPWLLELDEPERAIVAKHVSFLQRKVGDWDAAGLVTARALLEGVPADEMRRRMVVEEIDHHLDSSTGNLHGALARLAEDPFPLEMTRARTRKLALKLDSLRFTGLPADTTELWELLFELREHLVWAPEHLQYALTYLLPFAAEEGPDFFEEHVLRWIEGQDIVEARFAYNLACYEAQHGDTEALCAAISRALELGKPSTQFLADADFAGRLDEPEVRVLLGTAVALPRYYVLSRVSYYDAPCRFLDMGWKPDRPAWWKLRWKDGAPIDDLPEGPLRFPLKPYLEHASEMSRALPLLNLSNRIPIMQARLVEVLEAHGARLQKVPVVLQDPEDGSEHDSFFAVVIHGVLAPEALGRFHGRVADSGHIAGVGYSQATGHAEPLEGHQLAWIEDTFTLVVFEPLRDALVAAGFTELAFSDLSQVAT